MQNELQQVANVFANIIRRTGTIPGPTANLGKGDGLGTLLVPNGQPGEVFLHEPLTNQQHIAYMDPGSPLVLLQDGHPEIESIEVVTGYKWNSTQLTILGINTLAGRTAAGTLTPQQAFINEAWWAALNQITPLRITPTTPAVSMSVLATGPLRYRTPVGASAIFNTGLATPSGGLSAGEHTLALIYLDTDTNLLGATTLTPIPTSSALPAQSVLFMDAYRTAFTELDTWIPAGIVYLYYGQTSIAEADIDRTGDPRPLFSGGGGTSATDALNSVLTDKYGIILTDKYGRIITAS
jgi:hypothetical protein